MKRRLLQLKEESQDTFQVPDMKDVEICILNAKGNAIKISQECGMFLDLYDDGDLFFPGTEIINEAAENDYEDECIEEEEQVSSVYKISSQ